MCGGDDCCNNQLQDNLDDDEGEELLLAGAIEMLTFDITKAPQ
jgi:hypothetical protein